MPLPKHTAPKVDARKVLLSTYAVSKLVGHHRTTILRQLAHGNIAAEAWVDTGSRGLQPLFTPSVAIILARILPPMPQTTPNVSRTPSRLPPGDASSVPME